MKRTHLSLTALLGGVVLIAIALFVFGNMRDMLFGAPLTLHKVHNGATINDSYLPLSGNARHARAVLINGREIVLDRKGNFADGILLSPGYNVVEVTIRDQFGKERGKEYHLVLDEEHALAQVSEKSVNYSQ